MTPPASSVSCGTDLFSYAADRKPLFTANLILLIPPGRTISDVELVSKVREYISPGATEKDVRCAVYELRAEIGLDVLSLPPYDNYKVRHSEKSALLYPEYLTSIFNPSVWLEKVKFPGTGEIKDEDCGEVKGWKCCSHNPLHYRRPRIHSCNRKECPVCYTNWINQAVKDRILPRMEGFEDALRQAHMQRWGRPGKVWPARHFTISPPENEVSKMREAALENVKKSGNENFMRELLPGTFLENLMQQSYIALEKTGLQGAVVIPHFYRIKDVYQDYAVRLSKQLNEKLEKWKPRYNRYTAIATLPNYHDYLEFSPHIHVLAYGKAHPADEFERHLMPGWIYKNHKRDKQNDEHNGSYGGILYYILTHSPVIAKKQIIRYWGCLAPKRLKCIKSERALEEETCPDCGAAICPAVFSEPDGEGDLLEIDLEHPILMRIILKTFVIVGKPPPI